MMGAVTIDMSNRLVEAVDHLYGDDRRQILGFPVLLGRRLGLRHGPAHRGVAADGAACSLQGLQQGRQQRPGQGAVDQQGFCRSEEHTSELQSLMRISYAVLCMTKNNNIRVYGT